MNTTHTVKEVIDGDTIAVSPPWNWEGESGDRVRIADHNAPPISTPAGKAAQKALSDKVLDKDVTLQNPRTFSYGRVVCDVSHQGELLP